MHIVPPTGGRVGLFLKAMYVAIRGQGSLQTVHGGGKRRLAVLLILIKGSIGVPWFKGWPYLLGEQAEGHLRALPILFLLAALETGQPHCYLKHSASNESDRISVVTREGAQVVVRFIDGSVAWVDDDNLICGVW
jgi:hypothetical protein